MTPLHRAIIKQYNGYESIPWINFGYLQTSKEYNPAVLDTLIWFMYGKPGVKYGKTIK